MKTIVALMVVFLTINFSVAQEAEKEAEKLSPSMELMKLLNIEDTMENTSKMAFAPFLNQLRTKGMAEAGVKEVKEASNVYFSQVATDPDLKKEMANLYGKQFTASEIGDLVKFYKSPIGQKALKLMPQMTAAGGKLGEKYAEKYSAGFKEQLTRIMKKYPMK